MNEPWVVAAPLVATAVLLAVAPGDELGFLLQFFGAGTMIGTLVAFRATLRKPRRETFPFQDRWGSVRLTFAVGAMLLEGVRW